MDLNSPQFSQMYSKLKLQIEKVETFVAKIFDDTMLECSVPQNLYKIWIIAGDITKRPKMKSIMENNFMRLIEMAIDDANLVQKNILHHDNLKEKDRVHLYNANMGKVTGMIRYFADLKYRIMRNLNLIEDWSHIGSKVI